MSHRLHRKLDYSYIAATPQDGKRYELLDGKLFVNPSPNPIHQRVSRRLQRQLEDCFHSRSSVEVVNAPVDVILTPHDVFVPDLIVVGDPSHISRRGIEQPPLLVVEILSPSTKSIDRGAKSRRYAELAIQHYWIVDPEARRIDCFVLDAGEFKPRVSGQDGEMLAHPDWDGLVIDLAALWKSPRRRRPIASPQQPSPRTVLLTRSTGARPID